MKKTVLKLGLSALLATNLLLVQDGLGLQPVSVLAADAPKAQAVVAQKVKGKITNVSQKAKTVAMSLPDESFFLLKFTDDTKFKDLESSKDLKEGEAIVVAYDVVNGENVATTIAAALVELAKGTAKIDVDTLADLMAKDKNVLVIDSRPGIKYDEFHIPGSISIPFSKMAKLGDKAAELLEPYKDRQLVFYCGGTT